MHLSLMVLAFAVAEPPQPRLVAKPDAFPTLVNPNCSHCIDESKRRASELVPGDRVLCWTRGKYQGGAIPFRFFLNPYRVISDTYGTFVFDPDAGYARAFPASLDYRFHGWRNGVMVMKHKDGTLFSCLSGVAFDGPRKGERLESWPTIVTDWGWWLAQYKDTVAYHMYEKYKPIELKAGPNQDSVKSRGQTDPRLDPETMILGIWDGQSATAVRLDNLGDRPQQILAADAVVLWQPATRTATAYRPLAEKRKTTAKLGVQGELIEKRAVTIEVDPSPAGETWVDKTTGSRFDVTGRCIQGELKDWTLAPLDAVMVKWFAWSAEYPATTVHGVK
jgi:hypothetical protein